MATTKAGNNPLTLLLTALVLVLTVVGTVPGRAAELRLVHANDALGELEPCG